MENFDDWIDQGDDFDPENDPHPERNEADEATIARILGIGPRHVRRLTREGVLARLANSNYNRMLSIDAYVTHVTKPSRQSVGLRDRQAQLLQNRLDREAAELIGRAELRTTMGSIASAFIDSVIEVGELSGEGLDETERSRRREIARHATAQLEAKMGVEVELLITGKAASDE